MPKYTVIGCDLEQGDTFLLVTEVSDIDDAMNKVAESIKASDKEYAFSINYIFLGDLSSQNLLVMPRDFDYDDKE